MEENKRRKEKRSARGRNLILPGLSLVIILFLLLWMRPYFETNDDLAVSEFVNGARGSYDPHMVYQNYVLGLISVFFYRITGSIPWYSVLQYVLLLAAFVGTIYVLQEKLTGWAGFFMILTVTFYFGYECFVRIQYTKTAGILTSAGLLLLFYALSREKISPGAWILGALLAWFGFLYRSAQFAACFALMAVIGLVLASSQVVRDRREYGEVKVPAADQRDAGYHAEKPALNENLAENRIQTSSMILRLALGALSLLLPVGAAWGINKIAYEKDPVWRDYMEYNQLRTELLDYGFPDETVNRELYESLDLDGDALQLYRNWNFNDPDKFSVEVMKQLIAAKEKKTLSRSMIKQFVKEIPDIFLDTRTFRCFLLVFFYWLISLILSKDRKKWYALGMGACEVILFGLLYFYLFYNGRYGMNRVDTGLWFAALLVFSWLLPLASPDRRTAGAGAALRGALPDIAGSATAALRGALPGIAGSVAAVILAAALFFGRSEDWRIHTGERTASLQAARELFEKAGSDKDHLYIAKVGALSAAACYGPFDVMPFGIMDNICLLGGWPTNSALCLESQRRYEVENPYRDLVDSDHALLVDGDIDLTMRYIQNYYNSDARAEKVGELGNYHVYRICT